MTSEKWWLASKTVWLNVIAAVLAALEANLQVLQQYLPGNVYAWLLIVVVVGNAIMRAVTTQPISWRQPDAGGSPR